MAPFLAILLQVVLLPSVFGGAYFGHKPHHQQHQPVPFIPHKGIGKEMPHRQYPQYRKEIPQLPMHMNKGKDKKGDQFRIIISLYCYHMLFECCATFVIFFSFI